MDTDVPDASDLHEVCTVPSRTLRAQMCLQSSGHLRMEAACLQDA